MSSRRRQCKEERAKGFPPVKKLAPAGRFVLSGICRHEHALRPQHRDLSHDSVPLLLSLFFILIKSAPVFRKLI
jgi:hypothetical protein